MFNHFFIFFAEVGPPGEVLIIHNVTRYCDDIYTCVANNGVPPNSYRKVAVTVLCKYIFVLFVNNNY